jgi:hypothetical protein
MAVAVLVQTTESIEEPIITDAALEHAREMVAKFAAELATNPASVYARAWLAGWLAELKRLEEGRIY